MTIITAQVLAVVVEEEKNKDNSTTTERHCKKKKIKMKIKKNQENHLETILEDEEGKEKEIRKDLIEIEQEMRLYDEATVKREEQYQQQ